MKQRTTPCAECPFRRSITPGTLGGSPVATYIGQVNGPFFLPCHRETDFSDPNWRKDTSKPQCAGAAIHRANCGTRLAPGLLDLPASGEHVFSSHIEFAAHHMRCTIAEAQAMLERFRADTLTRLEMKRALAL